MNTTLHKIPVLWGTLVLVMGLFYACADADSDGDSTPSILIKAGDITYDKDRIAQGTPGTATPSSETIPDLSILTFSIDPIRPYVDTAAHDPPTIAKNGIITATATTTAGSYRVTITGNRTYTGTLTVDFYVTVKPANIGELDTNLKQAVENYGLTGDFNYIDTSAVTDMSWLFASGYTPGSNGTTDAGRTYVANFNGDISKWDVSSVEDFGGMFWKEATFNQDIGGWNVAKGITFSSMFLDAVAFNQDISGWNVSAGTSFNSMFQGAAAFNQDLSGWNLGTAISKPDMFLNSGVTNPPSWYTP